MVNKNPLPELLLINKPLHWTSNDVVRKIKSQFKLKKVGHCGTLDPLASGLLILGIGPGTKMLNQLITDSKKYRATIHFNYYTKTFDNEGEVVAYKNQTIDLSEITKFLDQFKSNPYFQSPPLYSAIKINGQKAYDLARKDLSFELPKRLVQLIDYEIISFSHNCLVLNIHVSKGFYVRSFAYDLGKKLNNFANLAGLVRFQIGEYHLRNAYEIEELNDLFY